MLPADWDQRSPAEVPAFAQLVRLELVPLLREFTGAIVVRRLERLPGLADLGIPALEEK